MVELCISNEEFAKMPANEQRVAIAKDAIMLLNNRHANATPLTYFEIKYDGDGEVFMDKQLNEHLGDVTCDVCAKGVLLLSHIARFDNFSIGYCGRSSVGNGFIFSRIGSIFKTDQLDMIESAFEGSVIEDSSGSLLSEMGHIANEKGRLCIAFGEQYDDNTERLLAILQNIIDNDGEFVPVLKTKKS